MANSEENIERETKMGEPKPKGVRQGGKRGKGGGMGRWREGRREEGGR